MNLVNIVRYNRLGLSLALCYNHVLLYIINFLDLGQSDSGHHAGRTQQTDQWNSSAKIRAGITDQEKERLGAGKCFSVGEGVSVWPAEGEFVIKILQVFFFLNQKHISVLICEFQK